MFVVSKPIINAKRGRIHMKFIEDYKALFVKEFGEDAINVSGMPQSDF